MAAPTPPVDVVAGAVATSAWANSVSDALQALIGDVYAGGAAVAIAWASVTGKPVTFAPTVHAHIDAASGGPVAYADIASKPASFVPADHVHAGAGTGGTITWTNIGSKPTTFVPSAHTHADAGTGGTIAWTNIASKPATFAPTAHAASHATGGGDAITPASIGAWAKPATGVTIYTGTGAPSAPVEGDIWVKA